MIFEYLINYYLYVMLEELHSCLLEARAQITKITALGYHMKYNMLIIYEERLFTTTGCSMAEYKAVTTFMKLR
jgi:hypothetical protein